MSDLRERVEALAGRRHSGTGILVYDNDADQVGKSWCSGCSKWLTPDEWRQPCTSRKERRKGERRALLTEQRGADTILSHERPKEGEGSKNPLSAKER